MSYDILFNTRFSINASKSINAKVGSNKESTVNFFSFFVQIPQSFLKSKFLACTICTIYFSDPFISVEMKKDRIRQLRKYKKRLKTER